METIFLYVSIIAVWILLAISLYFKPLKPNSIIIGIATTAYALVYDITLGHHFGLYYYIDPQGSVSYMVLAGMFLYPVLNIIYTLFLPDKRNDVLIYTGIWIIAMLVFEYASILTKTIVFTGWQPIPWSFVSYIVTYTLVYLFYRNLEKREAGRMEIV